MDAGSPACMTQPYLMWNPSSAGRFMNGALIGNLDPGKGKIDCWGIKRGDGKPRASLVAIPSHFGFFHAPIGKILHGSSQTIVQGCIVTGTAGAQITSNSSILRSSCSLMFSIVTSPKIT